MRRGGQVEERGWEERQRRKRKRRRSRRQQRLKKKPSRVESDGCEGTRSRRPALGTSGGPV